MFAASCTTTKNTLPSRTFHNVTARFNGYYYSCENIDEGIYKIEKGNKPSKPVVSTDKTICCDGEKATLTATGCDNGTITWTGGLTGTSIQVSTSGTYTATCTNICGTSQSSEPIVIRTGVKPTKPSITTTKETICGNETALLTATGCTTGTIKWSTGATGNTLTVSVAGTYSATCENLCGVSEASNVIEIKKGDAPNPPVVTASKTTICDSETASLTAAGCSGSLLWSNGSTTSVITVSVSGTYSAKCTNLWSATERIDPRDCARIGNGRRRHAETRSGRFDEQ